MLLNSLKDIARESCDKALIDNDLLSLLDSVFISFQLGFQLNQEREVLVDRILMFQMPDGSFQSSDRQRHNKWHATAYAVAALGLLSTESAEYIRRLSPLTFISDELFNNENLYLISTSWLDKLHHWRASHTVGGCLAIVNSISENRLDHLIPNVTRASEEVSKDLIDNLVRIANPDTGLWHGYSRFEPLFNSLYRRRHAIDLATIGGAAHYYWSFIKLGTLPPNLVGACSYTLKASGEKGIMEKRPYCLDFDVNTILYAGVKSGVLPPQIHEAAIEQLSRSRAAINEFLESRCSEYQSLHPIPGALAAIALADKVTKTGEPEVKDILDYVWWL